LAAAAGRPAWAASPGRAQPGGAGWAARPPPGTGGRGGTTGSGGGGTTGTGGQTAPVVQTTQGTKAALTLLDHFDGIPGNGDPSDLSLAVGPNHIVQAVNWQIAVYSKKGAMYSTTGMSLGTKASKSIFAGLGGRCEAGSDIDHGDTVVRYDQLAGRWVFIQPVFASPYAMCYAVSTSADPLGSYNKYEFARAEFPDYPRLGVWPTVTTSGPAPATTSCRSASASRSRQDVDGPACDRTVHRQERRELLQPVRRRRHDRAAGGRAEHRDGAGRDAAESSVRGRRRLRLQVPGELDDPVASTLHRPDEDHRRALPLPVRRPADELRAADGVQHAAWTRRATS
jgi:hypothetical protein